MQNKCIFALLFLEMESEGLHKHTVNIGISNMSERLITGFEFAMPYLTFRIFTRQFNSIKCSFWITEDLAFLPVVKSLTTNNIRLYTR